MGISQLLHKVGIGFFGSLIFFSLAKDFFLKLCNREPFKRYTVEQALAHPWITRDVKNGIPLTFDEQHQIFLKELEIANVFIVFLLLNIQNYA